MKTYRVIVEGTHKAWGKHAYLEFVAKARNESEAADRVEREFDLSGLEQVRYTINRRDPLPDVWQERGDFIAIRKA